MIATKLAIKKCLCCNDHDVYFSQKIKFTKITLLKKTTKNKESFNPRSGY